jgi:hypothetical protein
MMPVGAVYRDGTEGARAELKELMAGRFRELEDMPATYQRVYARRWGRAAAGATLVAGGVAMFALAIGRAIDSTWLAPRSSGVLTNVLVASWLAALIAYLFATAWSAVRFGDRLTGAFTLTGSLFTDIERARNVSPRALAGHAASRVERWSVALPLMGLALVLPLTLHLIASTVLDARWPAPREFDSWIIMSAVLVGHAHLVLAFKGWQFGRRIVQRGVPELRTVASQEGWSAWKWTVAVSAVPGLIIIGIPVVVVAVTGMYIPFAYCGLASRIRSERLALAGIVGAPSA